MPIYVRMPASSFTLTRRLIIYLKQEYYSLDMRGMTVGHDLSLANKLVSEEHNGGLECSLAILQMHTWPALQCQIQAGLAPTCW